MANVKVSSMTNPAPLGKLMPGANFATACIPITVNVNPIYQDSNNVVQKSLWNEVVITASFGNSGNIYVCNSAAAPDLTNYTNVIAVLVGGQSFPRSSGDIPATKDIRNLYLGADNATDFAIGFLSD